MNNDNWLGLAYLLAIGLLGCVAAGICYSAGYRQGQIDYHNGIIRYELQEQSDGQTVWKPTDASD